MSLQTVAHNNFRGEARPALSFHHSVFGGDLVLPTHAQIHGAADPAETDLVSWGRVVSDAGFEDKFGITWVLDVQSSDAH